MTSQELLQSTNIDWTVRKSEIQTVDGILIPDKVALVREDTNHVLSVMGNGYEMFQNHQLMELLFQISKSTGLNIHTSGMFDKGNLVYIQLKSDDLKLGTDRVEGFITGLNSFNGLCSLAFGNSNVTISCQNTFFRAFRNVDSKIRHTISLQPRVDDILRSVDVLLNEEKQVFNQIVRMNETGVSPTLIEMVKTSLFDLEKNYITENLSTRKQNQLVRFDMDMDIELKEKQSSVWGLFSSLTRYTTHSATKDLVRNQQNKMVGKTGVIERQLFNKLYELC